MTDFLPLSLAAVGGAGAPTPRVHTVSEFARSELFDRTFQEGMELVEETAAYLDGPGRHDSRLLSKAGALAYAGESMRLTTRLMQVASWLLVQRAVREGDMAAADACDARYRLQQTAEAPIEEALPGAAPSLLPPPLTALLDRSERLLDRVRRLDQRIFLAPEPADGPPAPLRAQHELLARAFGG